MNLLTYVHLRNIYRSTGVGRVARELTEHLAVLPGVNQRVLADPGDHREIIPKVGGPWTGYRYHFMQHETSRQQALWYLFNRPQAESYWPEVELVYCTAESYVPVRKAKLVVSCHDTQHYERGTHRMSFWLLKQRFKWRLLFDRLAQKADMFHMISEFAAERTAHFFPAMKSRLRVVPNAASEQFFRPPTEEGKQGLVQLGVADKPFVLVPGGLHHRKNADLILDAWPHIHRKNPELTLVINNHSSPMYVDRAKALPSLVLAGFQPEETLVALYNAAQLVWFPTRYEGFGMPVIEAMACGAPVISSNTSAIPEVAGGAATLLSPDNMNDHVDAITGLLHDSAARERFSKMGRTWAERYRWANSAKSLAAEFAALL
jgi:glycosyltransferase involved in cell wall biosynthesis